MTSLLDSSDPLTSVAPDDVAPARTPTALPVSSGGSSRSNLFSLKLAEILSTSYADSSIRDALQLLGERIQDNTPEMRRQFRANVEAEVIEANGQVLEQFSNIAMACQLETIGLSIANMNSLVGELTESVEKSKEMTKNLFADEEKLSATKKEVQSKQAILDAVQTHFIMSPAEVETLRSSAEKIDDKFFYTFNKAKKIYADCQALLTDENPVIGPEIMNDISRDIDMAFDRLFYWVQREIRNITADDPSHRRLMRRSLGVLAERSSLLQICLDGLSEIRQKVVLREFLDALTEGTKPIELFAYDAFRYVGDMLAWTHSETVNEKEILEMLFISEDGGIKQGLEEGLASEPWTTAEDEFDINAMIRTLADKNMQAVCKPLKARIDQVLVGSIDSSLAYRIYNLLVFYRSVFSKYLNESAQLLNVLRVLESSAMNQFHRSIKQRINAVQTDLPAISTELQPPQFLQVALTDMKTLMASFDASFALDESARTKEFSKIIEEALEPYLTSCITMADVSGMMPIEKDIFLINCFDASKTALDFYQFTKQKTAEFGKHITDHVDSSIAILHDKFLDDSKLRLALEALENMPVGTVIKNLEQFQEVKITEMSIALDEFLPSALMDSQTLLQRLSSPRLGNSIIQAAAKMFTQDFSKVEKAIIDNIEFPRSVFPRTLAEVKVLLVLD
ncbi:oligomeric Golgi complex subunit 6 [Limtongia smithiae]|uniref:oligomeric Golgi complex subunit 6 n=1 Tax=Limtongia smithiae TaxID=1125753 RepID=UPI0034CE9D70